MIVVYMKIKMLITDFQRRVSKKNRIDVYKAKDQSIEGWVQKN